MIRSYVRRAFSEIRYTISHEYIKRLSGNKALIGISHHAKEELGEIIYVDLSVADEGEVVEAGKDLASLESVKAAASVYSPIDVKLVKKNENAMEGINQDSEEEGWLWEVEIQNESDFQGLLSKDEYTKNL